jgi:hypothetical protein
MCKGGHIWARAMDEEGELSFTWRLECSRTVIIALRNSFFCRFSVD